VGGTALTLQIGHRISDDIDLFTTEKLDKEKIFKYAQNIHMHLEPCLLDLRIARQRANSKEQWSAQK